MTRGTPSPPARDRHRPVPAKTKGTTMSIRKPIAALAAVLFAIFQGCQTDATLASTGDRSSEGNGTVAFRLSERSVSILMQSSYRLEYKIFGAGMDTLWGSSYPKTDPILIENVPAGTRIVEVMALSWDGLPTWLGRDTIEVDPGVYTFAKITLTRQAPRYGTLVLDLDLDTSRLSDSLDPRDPIDTVWQTRRVPSTWGEYSYKYCEPPTWRGKGDSLRVNCFEIHYVAIPGDTIWTDTVVHYPVDDSSFWCRLDKPRDSIGWYDTSRVTYRCFRPHYEPWSPEELDTLWVDSVVDYPVVDTAAHCYLAWNDSSLVMCTEIVFLPNFDRSLCGTTVVESEHTRRTYNCLFSGPVDSAAPPRRKPLRG